MTTPPLASVRRALERAFAVAIAGERADPSIAAPAALRPLRRFRKLPTSALVTVANVLDADDEFRERVADEVDRDDVGRVAWLWLTRPDGWKDELASLLEELAADGSTDRDPETPKSLRRHLEGAERARDRAIEAARHAEAQVERLRSDAVSAITERDRFASQTGELLRRVDELTADRAAAVADLKRVETLLARRTDEKRALEARVEELEGLLRHHGTEPALSNESPSPELVALRRTIDDLQRRAEAFAGEIDALRRHVDGDTDGGTHSDSTDSNDDNIGSGAALTRRERPRSSLPTRPRRRPAPIPGGLTDDSEQAAAHLLARPGVVLLVDGYNLSMAAWPDLDIAEQRSRLERLLTDLAARHAGLTIELVFDGAEVLPLVRPGARRAPGVTVRFTAPDVEADDALLELCENYPHDRPVIVASNDRRVRDGARRRGANVLSADQLLGVARRALS